MIRIYTDEGLYICLTQRYESTAGHSRETRATDGLDAVFRESRTDGILDTCQIRYMSLMAREIVVNEGNDARHTRNGTCHEKL